MNSVEFNTFPYCEKNIVNNTDYSNKNLISCNEKNNVLNMDNKKKSGNHNKSKLNYFTNNTTNVDNESLNHIIKLKFFNVNIK